jgi:hypothetical protein
MTITTLSLKDKPLYCLDCGTEFIFAIGEQKYFASKGLSTPKRCAECRLKRKLSLVREGGELCR